MTIETRSSSKPRSQRQHLPIEGHQPTTRKNIIASILGALVFALLFNVATKEYLERHTINRGDWLIRAKWEKLLSLKQPVDWLILGDSSCNQGVVPRVFNQVLETTSVNLCTIGNMTVVNDAWMLETYIQKFGPPRSIVIVHVFDIWSRQLDPAMLAKVPLGWGYWQTLKPSIPLDFGSQANWIISRYFPIYSSNQSLAKMMMAPQESAQIRQNFQLDADGFMAWNQPDPQYVEEQRQMQVQYVQTTPFQVSEHNRLALDQIAALAEQYQFDVYFVNSPLYEGLYAEPAFQAYYKNIQRTIDEYVAKSDRIHYVLRNPMTFPKTVMENADHLIDPAAQIYTRGLAMEIRQMQK